MLEDEQGLGSLKAALAFFGLKNFPFGKKMLLKIGKMNPQSLLWPKGMKKVEERNKKQQRLKDVL